MAFACPRLTRSSHDAGSKGGRAGGGTKRRTAEFFFIASTQKQAGNEGEADRKGRPRARRPEHTRTQTDLKIIFHTLAQNLYRKFPKA